MVIPVIVDFQDWRSPVVVGEHFVDVSIVVHTDSDGVCPLDKKSLYLTIV